MQAIGKGSISSFLAGLVNLAWYIAAFGLAAAVLCFVLSLFVEAPGLQMLIPVSFTVDGPLYRVTSPSLGIEEAELQGPSGGLAFEFGQSSNMTNLRVLGSLKFPARRGAFLTVNAMLAVAFFALSLWVLGQLRAVFSTISQGQPFVPVNATRIRWIALAVIVGEVGRAAVAFFENHYAMTHFAADGLHFDAGLHLNVFAILNGLIILVIAEVFRAGTRLDEEQSLTV